MNSISQPLILIVEDEPKLASLLEDYLLLAEYKTHCIADGSDVLAWFSENHPSLILLDLMLPGLDGIEICKKIRESSTVPIIMVTAKVEEIDRLLGLEIGADDYICKPFSPKEVVARVKAVLRRGAINSGALNVTEVFVIDTDKYTISYHGENLTLTNVEFRLLCKLLSHRGKVYSRNQLLDNLYDDYRIVNQRTVDTHIKNIRKKLEKVNATENAIQSIYGVGYKIDV